MVIVNIVRAPMYHKYSRENIKLYLLANSNKLINHNGIININVVKIPIALAFLFLSVLRQISTPVRIRLLTVASIIANIA